MRMKNIAVNKKSVRCYKVTSACEFCIHVYTWCCMYTMISNFYRVRQVIIPRPTNLGELIAHVYLTY